MPRFLPSLIYILAITGGFIHQAIGQLYWDTNGAAVYSGNTGGIWGTDSYWSPDSHGISPTGAYSGTGQVVLAAGTDGTGTYSITLASGQTASGLDFQEGHITIAPTNPPTSSSALTATELLTLSGAAPIINVQNMDSVITARLQASGLTKNGVGKLTLNYGAFGGSNFFQLDGASGLVINAGTVELAGTGTSANQFNAASININSGATFLWSSGVNNIRDNAIFDVRTGGTLVTRVNDQVGTISGSGLIFIQGGALNLAMGSVVRTFGGIVAGSGTLQVNSGSSGSVTFTNANTFSGTVTSQVANVGAGGFILGHNRALQNAKLTLANNTTSTNPIQFATSIGTFIVGALEGTSDLKLQDTAGTAITLQVGNNDASTTYRGSLSGPGGLAKIGTGILTLTAENSTGGSIVDASTVHTYTGDTTIRGGAHNSPSASINSSNAGTLKLDFTAATTPNANIINSNSRLVLGGGRLWLAGSNSAATAVSQTFNGALLQNGRSYVTVTRGTGSADAVVHLGAISRNKGSILEFTLPTGTQSLTSGITTTTANDASGILGGWAVIGNEWAVKNTTGNTQGNIVAAGAGVYINYASGDMVTTAANNLLVNNDTPTISTAPGITDVNTIMVRNGSTTVDRVLDIATGETLRLGASGAIWNQGGGRLTIGATSSTSGTLTAGGALNTAGELIMITNGGEIVVNTSITDNGTGAVSLVRSGSSSQLILNVANTYSGGTYLTQGRTVINHSGALGSGAVYVTAGGQLWLNTNAVFSNDIFVEGVGHGEGGIPGAIRFATATLGTATSTITLTGDTRLGSVNGGTGTLAGRITGDYSLDLAGGASNVNVMVLSHSGNDFSGNFTINTTAVTNAAFSSANITVRLNADGVIPNGVNKGNVIITASTGQSVLDLNGFSETINSLISYGTHANVSITNSRSASTSTLTIGDNHTSTLMASTNSQPNAMLNPYSTFFGGAIKDTGTGLMALTKIGEGAQTLTGANTYSGATRIEKGSLMAGATNTYSANSDVTIANDATAMLSLSNGIADYSQTIRSLSGAGMVNLGTIAAADATRLTTGSTADTLYSGQIVGAGGLIKQGTGRFTLTGINTYVGSTQVSVGTLQVGVASVGQTGSGAVSVATNAILAGTGIVRGSATIFGTLRTGDNGGTDIGKLVFSDLTANSLTLSGGGSVANPRAVFTLAGATGNEASPLDGIQTSSLLNGAFGNHDAIEVYGGLNLSAGSVIKIELSSGYNPVLGDVFNLIDWGTVLGGSSTINASGFNAAVMGGDFDFSMAALSGGLQWETNQFLSDGIIYVTPEPGRSLLLLLGCFALLWKRRRS